MQPVDSDNDRSLTAPRLRYKFSRTGVLVLYALVLVVTASFGGVLLRQRSRLVAVQASQSRQSLATRRLQGQLLEVMQCFEAQLGRALRRLQADQAERFKRLETGRLAEMSSQLQTFQSQLMRFRRLVEGVNSTDAELHRQIEGFSRRLARYAQLLKRTLKHNAGTERILSQYSAGVCLIQGEYVFLEPNTGRPLRQVRRVSPPKTAGGKSSRPLTPTSGSLSPDGEGPTLAVQYTGSGFLARSGGYILTNQHVVCPWLSGRKYSHLVLAGYQPAHRMLRAFFPGKTEPMKLRIVRTDSDSDLAVLKVEGGLDGLPVLPLAEDRQAVLPGSTVVVLGYPTGFDVLLARGRTRLIYELLVERRCDFAQLGLELARRGLIRPVATRGMCCDVQPEKLIYDAQTATGGSGGPVMNLDGKVVAVNTALMRGFAGSNFGIPIWRAKKLLAEAIASDGPDRPSAPASVEQPQRAAKKQ